MNNKQSLSIEEQLLISIDSVLNKGEKCSFGDLVKESFSLFPKTFALSQFPNWPDSLKLDRQLRKLREKGLITGSPTTYYSLTKFGQSAVDKLKIEIKRRGERIIPKKPTRGPGVALLEKISESEEFYKFVKDKKNYKPNNMRIREIIKFTLETPKEVVVNYLNYLFKIAKRRKQKDLAEFLACYELFIREGKK